MTRTQLEAAKAAYDNRWKALGDWAGRSVADLEEARDECQQDICYHEEALSEAESNMEEIQRAIKALKAMGDYDADAERDDYRRICAALDGRGVVVLDDEVPQ